MILELQQCIETEFGDQYDCNQNSDEGRLARWAMYLIAHEGDPRASHVSSLFLAEFALDDSRSETRFATPFLQLMVGFLE